MTNTAIYHKSKWYYPIIRFEHYLGIGSLILLFVIFSTWMFSNNEAYVFLLGLLFVCILVLRTIVMLLRWKVGFRNSIGTVEILGNRIVFMSNTGSQQFDIPLDHIKVVSHLSIPRARVERTRWTAIEMIDVSDHRYVIRVHTDGIQNLLNQMSM